MKKFNLLEMERLPPLEKLNRLKNLVFTHKQYHERSLYEFSRYIDKLGAMHLPAMDSTESLLVQLNAISVVINKGVPRTDAEALEILQSGSIEKFHSLVESSRNVADQALESCMELSVKEFLGYQAIMEKEKLAGDHQKEFQKLIDELLMVQQKFNEEKDFSVTLSFISHDENRGFFKDEEILKSSLFEENELIDKLVIVQCRLDEAWEIYSAREL
jgi:hypothetical protein